MRDEGLTIGTGVVTKVLADLTPDELQKLLKGRTRKEKEAFLAKKQQIEDMIAKQKELEQMLK